MMNAALDQAVGLRRLLPSAVSASRTRVLPVFGTPDRLPAIVNLATALARTGQHVLVIDASRGEIAPAFGLSARYELMHVLEGDVALNQAVLATRSGVQVLPAARGMRMLAKARVSGFDFFESLAQRSAQHSAPPDVILVNAEFDERLVRLMPGHGDTLVVLPRGPQAMAEGAACLKQLATQHAMRNFRVLMMRCAFDEALRTAHSLAQFARRALDSSVMLGGNAPPDRRLWEAARVRRSVFDIDPTGPVARAFQNTAAGLMDWDLAMVMAAERAPTPAKSVTKLH